MKLIALDLDGTLLEPSGLISERTLEQLSRVVNQNVKVVIATGRPYARTIAPLEQNGLGPAKTYPHLLICEERDIYELKDGGYVGWELNQCAQEEEVSHLDLGKKLVARLEEIKPNFEFAINNKYSQTTRGFVEMYFVYTHEAEEAVDLLETLTQNTPLKVVRNQRNVLLRSRKIGKGQVLRKVVAHFGIDLNQVLAMGDSHNDLEMLVSGVRPATTQNADQDIKDVVLKSNGLVSQLGYSQGVGEILEKIVV